MGIRARIATVKRRDDLGLYRGESLRNSAAKSSDDMRNINKAKLMTAILRRLREDHEMFVKAARAAHAEATHEQSKAESKYDTRGLEAGYLAMGQGRKIADIEDDLTALERLGAPKFAAKNPIDLGALVELSSKAGTSFYLLAPRAGGLEIEFAKKEIWVITPPSPIGQLLMGRAAGGKFKFGTGPAAVGYEIVSVS